MNKLAYAEENSLKYKCIKPGEPSVVEKAQSVFELGQTSDDHDNLLSKYNLFTGIWNLKEFYRT